MIGRGLLAASAAALALGASPASAATCAAPAAGGEWRAYGNTYDNHRNQTAEKTISPDTVGELGVDWALKTPNGGVIHSVPTVADGCVFFGTDLGAVYAVNAETGAVVWERSLKDGGGGSNAFQGAGIVGAPAIADGRVYVGATAPEASVSFALDQATGAVIWSKKIDTDDGGGVDSSPVPFNGMVFQAYQGDESSNHSWPGYVILDAETGEILASEKVIPKAAFDEGARGGSIVDTPVLDLASGYLYAGTGSPASSPQHARTNAQVKIDIDPTRPTFGKIVDEVRGTSDSYPAPMDVELPTCNDDIQWPVGRFSCGEFDYNFLASGVLVEGAGGKQLFAELQKSGVIQAVDTATMDVVWKQTIGIPCFGCNLSSSASDGESIYVAVSGGNLYSLDAATGTPNWVVPGTGVMRFNGISIANGVVYSTNDLGALQAFDASSGAPLFVDPYMQTTNQVQQDLGNSSGISIAGGRVFVSAKDSAASTLFSYKLGAGGGGGGGGLPPVPDPPDGVPSGSVVFSGPGASTYGYIPPATVMQKGGTLDYTNIDIARHDVIADQKGADGLPLFASELAALNETVPVNRVEKLDTGQYAFHCSLHTGMHGTLVVQ